MGQKLNRIIVVLTILFTTTTASLLDSVNDKVRSAGLRLNKFRRSFYEHDRMGMGVRSATNEDNDGLNVRETAENLTAIRLANEHFIAIRTKHRCRTPRPKLIRVKDFYDFPSKEYLPRCTVLHQCDDESGCCEVGTMRCAPQHTETISLHFYVIEVGVNDNKSGSSGSTETLTFVNHTKCHCIEINYMPRNIINSVDTNTNEEKQQTTRLGWSSQLCKWVDCPKPFYPRLRHSDQRCVCDCFDRDRHCIRIKRGVNRLEPTGARCVRGGICLEPLCERGGTFNRHDATCIVPKHINNLNKNRQTHHQHNNQQHWLSERD